MCFSPQADLVGGLIVGAIGIDVLRHVGGRRHYIALAALPLALALHQIDEAFVWWGLQGHVPSPVGRVAMWIYLVFAFVVLPIYLPVAVAMIEPRGRRRSAMVPFAVLGAVVAAVLLAAMLRGPVTATLGDHRLIYGTDLRAGGLVVAAYVVATCGSLIFSGYRDVAVFGIVNLIAVGVVAQVAIDGFASLWCAWAAVASGAFALHLRSGTGDTGLPAARLAGPDANR
ncbi:MAG: hypothetical protein HZB15_12050 [Actinobacteria bacterium]|nr:hypothetical protein [Actinomycetota bacterium]